MVVVSYSIKNHIFISVSLPVCNSLSLYPFIKILPVTKEEFLSDSSLGLKTEISITENLSDVSILKITCFYVFSVILLKLEPFYLYYMIAQNPVSIQKLEFFGLFQTGLYQRPN